MASEVLCIACADPIDLLSPGVSRTIGAKPKKRRSDTKRCFRCYQHSRKHGTSVRALGKTRGWVCAICEQDIDESLSAPHALSASIDHVVPRALGGTNAPENLQLTHRRCNQRKAIGQLPKSAKPYNLRRWRRLSESFRSLHPVCVLCEARPSRVVDHILPLSLGGALWDETNLQALCLHCHNKKSQAEYRTACLAAGVV